MANATEALLASVCDREFIPSLSKMSGTVRFDVIDGDQVDHHVVVVKGGQVSMSDDVTRADCVISAKRTVLDAVSRGEKNAMAAVLRGEMGIEGDARLAVLIQRLFPDPPKRHTATTPAEGGHHHEF